MPLLDKSALSERDICTKYITPAIQNAGWDVMSQLREEVTFTKGRVLVHGKVAKRGESKRADYILFWKPGIPLAVVEAKDANHAISDGLQQALEYAQTLDIPFVFSSNGDGFTFHDRTVSDSSQGPVERDLSMSEFPSPGELWARYCASKGLSDEQAAIVAQGYFEDVTGKEPRYYQQIAINRAVEAIAAGQNRLLLVMATGTGKTFVAFQTIWRLWKAGAKKRVLFLADRNILVDQTKVNDFKPFGGAMTKIAKRQADKSFEIYLSLYQAVTGSEEDKNIYKQFSRDFFDLIIIDECHRGSAAADSAWREILDYFSGATQIGLTATPKETEEVSNIDYFGEPIYTYSLGQGIDDGFLAPYKVIRIDIDRDLTGWRPEAGKRDKSGQLIEDRVYNGADFDRTLVLEQRTQLVASKITDYLKATDRMAKTIVFCEDIDHASRMRRALVNENADEFARNSKYVMQITGDNAEGKAELDNFIDPASPYPVIVTTSKLLATGVDAQTCKLIVLDQTIRSMTEFKQIIGRGTRIREDQGKLFFTLMDFKKATVLFADPGFDGNPVQIYQPGPLDPVTPPDETDSSPSGLEGGEGEVEGLVVGKGWMGAETGEEKEGGTRRKYVVADVPVSVVSERVQYYSADGDLITESLKDYTRKIVRDEFESLEKFLTTWNKAERKDALVAELEARGLFLGALEEQVGRDYDAFDLVCHIAFDRLPLTRRERADNVKKRDVFSKYGAEARAVLDALLDKYAEEGVENIESMEILNLHSVTGGKTRVEVVKLFGGKEGYEQARRELEDALYFLPMIPPASASVIGL
jgi:type I restriction enzyme R subunit